MMQELKLDQFLYELATADPNPSGVIRPPKKPPTPQKWNPDTYIKRKYGITREEWDALFEAQGSKCVFGCTTPGGRYNKWATDHDHETGKVRGILCQSHNLTLGHIEKHMGDVEAMVAYVKEHRPSK